MSTPFSDYGISLSTGTGGPPLVYTAIAAVRKLKPPAVSQGSIEYTAHDSGGLRKWIASNLHGWSSFGATIAYDPADTGHEALMAAVKSHAALNLRITWPDTGAETWDFSGIIESFTPGDHDAVNPKLLEAQLMIKPLGDVTVTA